MITTTTSFVVDTFYFQPVPVQHEQSKFKTQDSSCWSVWPKGSALLQASDRCVAASPMLLCQDDNTQLASASCMVVLAEQHERHLNVGGWPPTIWFVGKISKERAHAARDLLVTTK